MLAIMLSLLVVGGFLGMSLAVKIKNNRYSRELEQVNSPLAEAITQLIGIAGGIYLSLVMAINFLGITWPEKISFCGSLVDPVAILAIVLSGIQPVVLWLWHKKC